MVHPRSYGCVLIRMLAAAQTGPAVGLLAEALSAATSAAGGWACAAGFCGCRSGE
jgi:hypothetical protein